MLDLGDIQGNILRGYRSYPRARFLYFRIESTAAARRFLSLLIGAENGGALITPAQWGEPPQATTNIALTFDGLRRLGLPAETLAGFPAEFQEGMRARARMLGDTGTSAPSRWEEPWGEAGVHLLLTCYAKNSAALDERCATIRSMAQGAVIELEPSQDAAALSGEDPPRRIEHFGFADGLSNPDVEDTPDDGKQIDTGNLDSSGHFRKVAIGEFLLGHRNQGGELSPAPRPPLFAQNGTFLVLRKLSQDVASFRRYLREQAAALSRVLGPTLPPGVTAEDFLAAKMIGRWRNGTALALCPDAPGADATNAFTYADDPTGARCPLGAHVRRAYPRAGIAFGPIISSRRRLIRRGMPYGNYLADGAADDGSDRGLMFLAFNASIERQFEFVQSQWLNQGEEFDQGDDADPIVGHRLGDSAMIEPGKDKSGRSISRGRMMIAGDERNGRPPFLCTDLPRFVTTRGGDYFFVPAMTAMRLLAAGSVKVT